jgi:hypothetical protein
MNPITMNYGRSRMKKAALARKNARFPLARTAKEGGGKYKCF